MSSSENIQDIAASQRTTESNKAPPTAPEGNLMSGTIVDSDTLPNHYYTAPQYFYQDYEIFGQRPKQIQTLYAFQGHFKPLEFVHPYLTAEEEAALIIRTQSVWVEDRFVPGEEFADLVRQASKQQAVKVTESVSKKNSKDVVVKVSGNEKPAAMSHQEYFDSMYNPTQYARSKMVNR